MQMETDITNKYNKNISRHTLQIKNPGIGETLIDDTKFAPTPASS